MGLKELKMMAVEDLRDELIALRQNQLKLTMQKASGQLSQTHQIRQNRRDIARIKTLLSQQGVGV